MPASTRSLRRLVLAIVYLATPVFLVLDWSAGLNLRAAFLESRPPWKWSYYGLLLVLGVAMALLPQLARPLATVEAGMNALLTSLMVLLPYVEMIGAAERGDEIVVPDFPLLALFTSVLVLAIARVPGSFRSRRASLTPPGSAG